MTDPFTLPGFRVQSPLAALQAYLRARQARGTIASRQWFCRGCGIDLLENLHAEPSLIRLGAGPSMVEVCGVVCDCGTTTVAQLPWWDPRGVRQTRPLRERNSEERPLGKTPQNAPFPETGIYTHPGHLPETLSLSRSRIGARISPSLAHAPHTPPVGVRRCCRQRPFPSTGPGTGGMLVVWALCSA